MSPRKIWLRNGLILLLALAVEALCIFAMSRNEGRMFLFHLFGMTYEGSRYFIEEISLWTLSVFLPCVAIIQLRPRLDGINKFVRRGLLFLFTLSLVILGAGIHGTAITRLFSYFAIPGIASGFYPEFLLPGDNTFGFFIPALIYLFQTGVVLVIAKGYRWLVCSPRD